MQQSRVTGSDHNNSVNYAFFNSLPSRLTQFAEPTRFSERVNHNLGLYVHDQWTLHRFTLNLGLRADFLNAQVDAQNLPAGALVGARSFGPVEDVPAWRDVSPRLGLAYDLRGTGRTVLKTTLGRYVVGESYGIARNVNPLQSTVSSAQRTWNDRVYPVGDPRRGNFVPDCDLINVAANGECGAANPNTFGQLVVNTRYDDGITEGFGVRPYNWGVSVTVEQEITHRASFFAGYFRRWYGNFNTATKNLAVTNADFSPFCINVPRDPRLPGAGEPLCGFYDISLEKFGETNALITASQKFGGQEDVYDGVDVSADARLPGGALLRGGVSVGRERTNTCYVLADLSLLFSATSPRAAPFCDIHPPLQPIVRIQAVQPLPWSVQASVVFQSNPGPQILAQQTMPNAQIVPTLGRSLASCGASAACNDTVLVDLLPPGTAYGDRVNQVDLRVTRTWKAGRTTLRPAVSIYNLFNASPILQYSNRYSTGWPAATGVLAARFVDFGVQLDF